MKRNAAVVGALSVIAIAGTLVVAFAFTQAGRPSQGPGNASGPPLLRPVSTSLQDWVALWSKRLPLKASIQSEFQQSGGFQSRTTNKIYTVSLAIDNKTGLRMSTGEDLYVVETAADPKLAAKGTLTTPSDGFGPLSEPPINYAGSVRLLSKGEVSDTPYGVFEWRSNAGGASLYSPSHTVVTISSIFSSLIPCDDTATISPDSSKDALSFRGSVALSIRVKEKPKVYLVSPTLTFADGNRTAEFRYLIGFDKEGDVPSEVALLPLTAEGLVPIIASASDYPWKRVFAMYWAGQRTFPDSQKAMSALLAKDSAPDSVRIGALTGLGLSRNGTAVDSLLRIADDESENAEVRRAAIYSLGLIADSRGAAVVRKFLDDKDPSLVREAIGAMGRFKEPDALERLFRLAAVKRPYGAAYWDDRVNQIYAAILSAADETNVPFLAEQARRKDNPEGQNAAVRALAKLGTANALSALTELFGVVDSTPKTIIVKGVAANDNAEAINILKRALDDKTGSVQTTAVDAIGSKVTGERTAILVGLTASTNGDVQRKAIELLASRRAAEGKEKMAAIIASGSANPQSVVAAARGLACYPGDDTVDVLAKGLEHRDAMVRSNSIDSLAHLRAKRVLPAIAQKAQDTDANVRVSVAQALGASDDRAYCPAVLDVFKGMSKEFNSGTVVRVSDSIEKLQCKDRALFKDVLELLDVKNFDNQVYCQEVVRLLKYMSGQNFEPENWIDYRKKLPESKRRWMEWIEKDGAGK